MDRPRLSPSEYTIAWVSALPIEWAAATEMLDEEHCKPQSHGSNPDQAVFGRVGDHNVIMACLPAGQMGNSHAAAVAARLIATFPSIKFALMVGIGGGVPTVSTDVRLGDVVISQPHLEYGGVVQYDFGKTGPNGKVQRTGFINAPPKALLDAIAKLRANHYRALNSISTHLSAFDQLPQFSRDTTGPDVLIQAAYHHHGDGRDTCESCNMEMEIKRPERERNEVVIHYGTIASGNQVMKDGLARDRISAELGGVLCFEMEAAGLASAFPCAVIRGICDYADSHKNKGWQPYAAATAAVAAKELLLTMPGEEAARAEGARAIIETEKYRVPFSLKGVPIGRFAERLKDMQRLEQCLLPRTQGGNCRRKILVLDGLGGIGKTQLAVEFARKHQAVFTSVFWLNGNSRDSLKQSIIDCVSRIPERQVARASKKHPSSTGDDLDAVVSDFMKWLSRAENKHWLIIFDNVDRDYLQETDIDSYDVSNYIPDVDHGSVLLTTRLANLQQLGQSLHLESVDMIQARAIFRMWYNHDFAPHDSSELLQLLDGLPLALAQAAAYMSETGTSFCTYTKLYKEQWKDIMQNADAAPLRSYGNRSIATTWTVSYNAIRAKNEEAANLLLLWAHLDNKTLPFWILQNGMKNPKILGEGLSEWLKDAASNEVKFLNVVRVLRSYCLVESLDESSTHSIHPLVHQWALHIQDEHQQIEFSHLAGLIIGHAVPDEYDTEYHPKQRQLLPHVEYWMGISERITNADIKVNEKVLSALHMMGMLLSDRGNIEKAEIMYQRALEGKEKAWGRNHTSTLDTINNLGILYADQGKLAEAEAMYQRALRGYEKAWGRDHTSTLDTIHNLGLLYADQGKLAEAEVMYQRALGGYEKAWGPNHTSTLDTINNLGLLYADQDKLVEAEAMYQRALEGYEKAWGRNHTSTLDTIHNLGLLYVSQGKLVEAEMMYQRALEGYENAWGPNHTATLDTVHNLGNLYRKQGKLVEAEMMYQRALEGYEKAWGPNHTATLDTVNSLGNLYADQDKLAEAKVMYQRALEGKEKAWGPNHTSTLETVHNLGYLYADQDKLVEAEAMYQRALEGKEKAWGPNHTSTLDTVHNLGSLYRKQRKLAEAEIMYQRALEGKEKAWGPTHTSTLDTVNSLGLLYANQDKLAEAEMMYQRALEGKEKAWGPNHTSTLNTVNNLGNLYTDQGKLAEAEMMYQRALEGYEKAWGPNHTSTLDTVNSVGNLYADQGKLAEAEMMYQRALEGYEKAWGRNHTSTLNTVHNLGLLYTDQGKLAEAEMMYQRALEGYEKALGPNHTSTLDTVNELGKLFVDQGKLVEAEAMYQRALDGKEKAWGQNHTSILDTVNNLSNLASLYRKKGKLAEAEMMYQRALESYEEVLGPDTVSSFVPALHNAYNYGLLFEDQGRLSDAKLMYSRALRGYEVVFGADYRWCLAAKERLQELEKPSDSHPLSRRAASLLDQQITDISPSAESAEPKTSKRLRIFRKLKLR